MKDGLLKKARARIVNEAISHFCALVFTGIFAAISAGMLIFWAGFRKFLSTEYYFELPLWAWMITGLVFAGLVVVLIKDRWKKLTDPDDILTDPDDIGNKLMWYLGKNRDYVANETYNKRPVVWHYAKIDKTIKLKRGSSKKYLPEILDSDKCPFPVKVLVVSSKTISLEYDYSDYSGDPRVISRQPSS